MAPHLNAMLSFRDQIRAFARDHKLVPLLELCDAVRDDVLVDLGVRVEDRTDAASLWKMDDPATLRCAPLHAAWRATSHIYKARDGGSEGVVATNASSVCVCASFGRFAGGPVVAIFAACASVLKEYMH